MGEVVIVIYYSESEEILEALLELLIDIFLETKEDTNEKN